MANTARTYGAPQHRAVLPGSYAGATPGLPPARQATPPAAPKAEVFTSEGRRILGICPDALRSMGEELARQGVPFEEARARLLAAHQALHGKGPRPPMRPAAMSDEAFAALLKGALGGPAGGGL